MKRQMTLWMAGVAVGMMAAAGTAQAAMQMDAPLEADTYVNGGSNSGTSYDAKPTLLVKYHYASISPGFTSNSTERLAYLRFDISGLPSGAIVTSIQLNLNVTNVSIGVAGTTATTVLVYGLNDGVAGETTVSDTLTWDTRPDKLAASNGDRGVPNTASTGPLATQDISKDFTGQVSFTGSNVNGSADLLDFLNADTNGAVVFILGTEDNVNTGSTLPPPAIRTIQPPRCI